MSLLMRKVKHSMPADQNAAGETMAFVVCQFRNNNNTLLPRVFIFKIIIIIIIMIKHRETLNYLAVELIQELGRRISGITQDTKETGFLFQ